MQKFLIDCFLNERPYFLAKYKTHQCYSLYYLIETKITSKVS